MALRLYTTAQLFHAKVPNIFPHISSHDLPCHKTMKRLCLSQVSNFSMLPAEILDSNIFCGYPQYPSLFDILLECNPNTHGQRTMSALPINVFHSCFPSRIHVFCFYLPVWFRPRVQIRIVVFQEWEISIHNLELFSNRVPTELSRLVFPTVVLPKDDRTDSAQEEQPGLPYWTMILVNPFSRCTNEHSQLETFSQAYFNRIFSNCLSHKSPAKEWPYRFRSGGTTGSSILDNDFGHVCFGRRIQMSGHSNLDIYNNFGASFIFTWVQADTASAACPEHPGSLDMISMTFATVIWDADDRCSVNTT